MFRTAGLNTPEHLVATFSSLPAMALLAVERLDLCDCKLHFRSQGLFAYGHASVQVSHSSTIGQRRMLARKEGTLQRTGSWRLPLRYVPLVPRS